MWCNLRTNRPQEGTEQRNTRAPEILDNDCETDDVQKEDTLTAFYRLRWYLFFGERGTN